MAKKKAKSGNPIKVYRVHFRGTEDGSQEYDDNNYFDVGVGGYDLPGVHAKKEKAEAECAYLNADYRAMSDAVCAFAGAGTPFFEYSGDDDAGTGFDYAARLTLPWPQLWDKCLDLGIDPPTYEEDASGNKTRPDTDPQLEELQTWWDDQINGSERVEELDAELAPYLNLPVPYEVREETISDSDRAELAKAFAADAGVADNKRLQITLLDQNNNHVATYSGKANEMIAKANEFLILHGTEQKAAGTIQFSYPAKKAKRTKPEKE